MRTVLRIIAVACAASCGVPASAASEPASAPTATAAGLKLVRDRLKIAPVLKGEFEQTKTIAGFRYPLVSRGEFLVARGQGVWWHTQQPFETTLVVTRTRMFRRNADGSGGDVVDEQAEPGAKRVNELVFALLAADLDALADKFTLVAQPVGAAGWTLALTPRDPGLAKFLARATLAGERDVQSVRIEEARGDATQIRFAHQQPSDALSADEAARFK